MGWDFGNVGYEIMSLEQKVITMAFSKVFHTTNW